VGSDIVKNTTAALAKVILYVVLYVVAVVIQWIFTGFLPLFRIDITDYMGYAQILKEKYDHATAAAIRNVVRIIGIGALVASIAGGVAGGAAGVALGDFIGMVIGFACQQVLGQAIAGLFLLIARPFRIDNAAVLAGVVDDVATLFTVVIKGDGTKR